MIVNETEYAEALIKLIRIANGADPDSEFEPLASDIEAYEHARHAIGPPLIQNDEDHKKAITERDRLNEAIQAWEEQGTDASLRK